MQHMTRTHINLPQPLKDALRDHADKTGISVSEIIRAAVAQYLKAQK